MPGPQAAFTTKELREITRLEGVALRVLPPGALAPTDADLAELKVSRQKKRVHDILAAAAAASPADEEQQRCERVLGLVGLAESIICWCT